MFMYFVPQVSINDRTISAGTMLRLSAVSGGNGDKEHPFSPQRMVLNGL
jgi:hypothetical protein